MALVFFNDPEAPARCALELSEILRSDPEIKLRMGIHSGPVYRVADINANRNVAGGGINTAQRVMDCGDAGHILVSSTAANVLAQLSVWSPMLHDLGEVSVKHGDRVHLYNLYADGAGNPELPAKIGRERAHASTMKKFPRSIGILFLALLVSFLLWVRGQFRKQTHVPASQTSQKPAPQQPTNIRSSKSQRLEFQGIFRREAATFLSRVVQASDRRPRQTR